MVRLVVAVVFLAVLTWYGATYAQRTLSQNFITVRWLSLGWGTAALPVGAALMLAGVLWRGWKDVVRPAATDETR